MAGHAYIGSFTSAGGRGLTTAAVDPDTGALTVLGSTDAVPNPSFLAAVRRRRTLYAVSETDPDRAARPPSRSPTRRAPRLLGAPVPVARRRPHPPAPSTRATC